MTDDNAWPPRNGLKDKLAAGKVCASMIVRMSRGTEIARIAMTAGFDALYVDLEHSTLSVDTACQICMTAADLGVTPLVRVAGPTSEAIGQVLDGGALGVIASGVESAADARQVVERAKFPPLGRRSLSSALPQLQYRAVPGHQAMPLLNERTLVAVMIESTAAMSDVDAIAATEGVDLLHVGMHDLAASMGATAALTPTAIDDIFDRVLHAARRHGKHVGVGGLATDQTMLRELVRRGVNFVSAGTDLAFLSSAAAERARFVHGLQAAETSAA